MSFPDEGAAPPEPELCAAAAGLLAVSLLVRKLYKMNVFLMENGKESSFCTENTLTLPGIGGKLNLEMYAAQRYAPTGAQFQKQTMKGA